MKLSLHAAIAVALLGAAFVTPAFAQTSTPAPTPAVPATTPAPAPTPATTSDGTTKPDSGTDKKDPGK